MGSLWPDSTTNLGTVLVRITTSCLRKQIGSLWNTISNKSPLSKSCRADFCSEPFSGLPSWLTTDNLGCRMFFSETQLRNVPQEIFCFCLQENHFSELLKLKLSASLWSQSQRRTRCTRGAWVWVLDYSPTVFFIGFVRFRFSFSFFASFAWTATFLSVTHSFLSALLYQTSFFP